VKKYHGEFAVLDFPNFTTEITEIKENSEDRGQKSEFGLTDWKSLGIVFWRENGVLNFELGEDV
jgi:hypothetical protein